MPARCATTAVLSLRRKRASRRRSPKAVSSVCSWGKTMGGLLGIWPLWTKLLLNVYFDWNQAMFYGAG
jgi:hypothetical protein